MTGPEDFQKQRFELGGGTRTEFFAKQLAAVAEDLQRLDWRDRSDLMNPSTRSAGLIRAAGWPGFASTESRAGLLLVPRDRSEKSQTRRPNAILHDHFPVSQRRCRLPG